MSSWHKYLIAGIGVASVAIGVGLAYYIYTKSKSQEQVQKQEDQKEKENDNDNDNEGEDEDAQWEDVSDEGDLLLEKIDPIVIMDEVLVESMESIKKASDLRKNEDVNRYPPEMKQKFIEKLCESCTFYFLILYSIPSYS